MKKKKAMVAGHICVDITPVFPGSPVPAMEEILKPGKLIRMDGVDIHTGGAVANTGLAMKLLDCDVSLMGKVGDDAFGKIILEALGAYGAQDHMIVSPQSSTSYSVVLAVPGIDRIFLHDPGANDTFGPEDLDWEAVKEADLVHFGYPPLMKRMYREDGRELEELLRRVKECGAAVSLDLAAVDPASEAGEAGWDRILERVLPYVDFFVPSAEELCFMLDKERFVRWNRQWKGSDLTKKLTKDEILPLAGRALALGAKVVLVKCGAQGIYYRTAGAMTMSGLCRRLSLAMDDWAGKEGFEESFRPECVRSGTGAGDVSIASFLASVLRGEPLAEAVQMAAAAGACCVEAYDALSGLKTVEELKVKIRQGWKKNKTLFLKGDE